MLKIKTNGFTMIEVIVAMTIISIVLLGIFQLLSQMSNLNAETKDRIFANYLVQKCSEETRNQRDTNWLQGKSWNKNLNELKSENKKFTIEREKEVLEEEIITIEKEKLKNPISIKFICSATWDFFGNEKKVSVSQILTNWRKK